MDDDGNAVHCLTVPASAAGQRLDRWLTEQFPGSSRSAVQRWIADGLVQVNGERPAKAGMALEAAAQVEVVQLPPQDTTLQPQEIPLDIIYEDGDLLVVDKQAGLVVHPGPGHATGTLANAVLHHCPGLEGISGERRPGIVHRLDKGTSGLIVVAKSDAAMRLLQEQFAARTVRKEYIALLEGRIEPPRGRIDAQVGRHPIERQRMAVLPAGGGGAGWSGRAAMTDYERLRVYDSPDWRADGALFAGARHPAHRAYTPDTRAFRLAQKSGCRRHNVRLRAGAAGAGTTVSSCQQTGDPPAGNGGAAVVRGAAAGGPSAGA